MNECFITFPRGVIVNPPLNGMTFFLKEHSDCYPLTFFMRYTVRAALYQTPTRLDMLWMLKKEGSIQILLAALMFVM